MLRLLYALSACNGDGFNGKLGSQRWFPDAYDCSRTESPLISKDPLRIRQVLIYACHWPLIVWPNCALHSSSSTRRPQDAFSYEIASLDLLGSRKGYRGEVPL